MAAVEVAIDDGGDEGGDSGGRGGGGGGSSVEGDDGDGGGGDDGGVEPVHTDARRAPIRERKYALDTVARRWCRALCSNFSG
jgi:hypothetical protein